MNVCFCCVEMVITGFMGGSMAASHISELD